MKCPKCGYQSFNDLTNCKKCGRDLSAIQAKLNFGKPVVVTSPLQPRTPDIPAQKTEPIEPSETAVQEPELPLQSSTEEDDEHLLEDFFQSIDTPQDRDLLPETASATKKSTASTAADKASARKIPDEFPQWQQETPQGDFPFDELDADLDVLRLDSQREQTPEAASPFDDVESFELNWQLPIEEDAASATLPKDAEATDTGSPPTETRELCQDSSATTDLEAESQPAEPAATETAIETPEEQIRPAAADLFAEADTVEEEWLLPEAADGYVPEEEFALTEADTSAPDAKKPAPDLAALQRQGQEELPLAVEESGRFAQPADIAAIFLPDTNQDAMDSGARLLARRAKAYLADLGLLTVIFALFVCAGEIARSPASGERFRFTGDVLLDLAAPYFLVFFSLCFGYFTLFHYLSGQTPGKMLFDLRVEGEDHAEITLAQAFLRCVGGLASLLPAGLGYLSIVLDVEHKGWNDRLAGCQVVMVEEPGED